MLWMLAAWLAAGAAFAQGQEPLTSTLTSQRVITKANGKETLVPADKVRPGEVIQYTVAYQNNGSQKLGNIEATLPIPAWMKFLDGSAQPAPSHASLDGLTFDPVPLKRLVRLADCSVQEQVVPASEYRALRWSLGDLAPGASTNVAARARLDLPTVLNK